MKRRPRYAFALAALTAALAAFPVGASDIEAQEDWVIRSFDARYVIDGSGTFSVTEEIEVDFGSLERHGIFRDMPVEYEYDKDNNRLTDITGISVTDGGSPVPFETSKSGPNLRIKIGDPCILESRAQRFVRSY